MSGIGLRVRASLLYSRGLLSGTSAPDMTPAEADADEERNGLLPLVLIPIPRPTTGDVEAEDEDANMLNSPLRRGRLPCLCRGRKSNPIVVPINKYFSSSTAPHSGCPCFETGREGDSGHNASPIDSREGGARGASGSGVLTPAAEAEREVEVLERGRALATAAVDAGDRTPRSDEARSEPAPAPLNCLKIREVRDCPGVVNPDPALMTVLTLPALLDVRLSLLPA